MQGNEIILLARNPEKAKNCIQKIIAKTGNNNLHYIPCELFSQKSVRAAGDLANKQFEKIDVLINNAGGIRANRVVGEDGIEWTFAVNYISPLLLSFLLMDKIKSAGNGRIVNTSSVAHRIGKINFENLNGEKQYNMWLTYGTAKLAIIMGTYSLAFHLKNADVTVNTIHPGIIATPFGSEHGGGLKWMMPLYKPFSISPEKGAETIVYLAVSKEVENISGKYWVKCKAVSSSKKSYDAIIGKELWERSLNLAGIT